MLLRKEYETECTVSESNEIQITQEFHGEEDSIVILSISQMRSIIEFISNETGEDLG